MTSFAYAIEELVWRREMLRELAPATDHPERMHWKMRVLDAAVARLRVPYFEMNPFV
jgi:hypothetical protein